MNLAFNSENDDRKNQFPAYGKHSGRYAGYTRRKPPGSRSDWPDFRFLLEDIRRPEAKKPEQNERTSERTEGEGDQGGKGVLNALGSETQTEEVKFGLEGHKYSNESFECIGHLPSPYVANMDPIQSIAETSVERIEEIPMISIDQSETKEPKGSESERSEAVSESSEGAKGKNATKPERDKVERSEEVPVKKNKRSKQTSSDPPNRNVHVTHSNRNFIGIFVAIVLALILVHWWQRTVDLFVFDYLGLSKTSLTQNLLIAVMFTFFFLFMIWMLDQYGINSESTIVSSIDV